jgi:hypothetical protein
MLGSTYDPAIQVVQDGCASDEESAIAISSSRCSTPKSRRWASGKEGNRAMNIQTLQAFFMWCTIINGALLVIWTIILAFAPGWMYRVQSRRFSIPRDTFNILMYAFLGVFKVLFLLFNAVPFVALVVIG